MCPFWPQQDLECNTLSVTHILFWTTLSYFFQGFLSTLETALISLMSVPHFWALELIFWLFLFMSIDLQLSG